MYPAQERRTADQLHCVTRTWRARLGAGEVSGAARSAWPVSLRHPPCAPRCSSRFCSRRSPGRRWRVRSSRLSSISRAAAHSIADRSVGGPLHALQYRRGTQLLCEHQYLHHARLAAPWRFVNLWVTASLFNGSCRMIVLPLVSTLTSLGNSSLSREARPRPPPS